MAEGTKKSPPHRPSNQTSVLRQMGAAAGVGFEFIFAVLLPAALGYWLDKRFGTSPWLAAVGGVFGFGVGLYRLLKSASDASQ